MDDLASTAVGRRLHVSAQDPLCPLCGADLGIPPIPEKPCMTLEKLARHFGADCPATLRVQP